MFNFFKRTIRPQSPYDKKSQTYLPSSQVSWEELERCLTNPYFRPEFSWRYDTLPQSIDIGKIGKIADDLLSATKDDPKHRERGTYVKVDVYDRLLARKAEFADIGNEYSVNINHTLENYSIFRYGDTSEKLAAIIHTHPKSASDQELIDIPSFLDITGLLTDSKTGTSLSIIYTEYEQSKPVHWCLVRTKDTPQIENLDDWLVEHNRKFHFILRNSADGLADVKRFTFEVLRELKIGAFLWEEGTTFAISRGYSK